MEEIPDGKISFSDIAIVSCGTLNLELNHLKQEGFLDAHNIFYTKPGLHQNCHELENQLVSRIKMAKEKVDKVIVIYGGKFCYVNVDEPTRTMQKLIDEQGSGIGRVQATHCMDMIADEATRDQIAQEVAGGEKVWWMTPGWVEYRYKVFEGWDKGIANENFPSIRAVPLFWTASVIWINSWRKNRKNFWNTATGWVSPCRDIPSPWTGSNRCSWTRLKFCKRPINYGTNKIESSKILSHHPVCIGDGTCGTFHCSAQNGPRAPFQLNNLLPGTRTFNWQWI
jgi:hypothetical protein